jgi:hypothetical protein
MRRLLLLPLFAFFAVAAGPAEEARRLLDAGQEREAFEMAERAAALDDLGAIHLLGWFYDEGRVVAQDDARAAGLYRRAAERGHAESQWRLGVLHDAGEGVRDDPAEAVRLFRRAAAQGFARAHTSMGVMHATGRGVPRDYGEAMRSYREGARLGDAHGFYGVAVLYGRGEGVPTDPIEAFAWAAVSASMGDEEGERVVQSVPLDPASMERAVARANEIIRETGADAPLIQFRSEAEERPAPVA